MVSTFITYIKGLLLCHIADRIIISDRFFDGLGDSELMTVTVTPGPGLSLLNDSNFVTVIPESPYAQTREAYLDGSDISAADHGNSSESVSTSTSISSSGPVSSSESSDSVSEEDKVPAEPETGGLQPIQDEPSESEDSSAAVPPSSSIPAVAQQSSSTTTSTVSEESLEQGGISGLDSAQQGSDENVSSGSSSSSPVPPSAAQGILENEYGEDVRNITQDEGSSSAVAPGNFYPVTTTTTVTPSSAPWPYPTSTPASVMSTGACLFDGRVYMSAQQIPRDDPCDFCFCFRGDIICLQQSCPPPIPGCYEEPIPGFCCPRYECPVGNGNVTTQQPPLFPPSYYHNQILNGVASGQNPAPLPPNMPTGPGCEIQGGYYESGQVITSTSGPCLECRYDSIEVYHHLAFLS
jgi:hypothetical protein